MKPHADEHTAAFLAIWETAEPDARRLMAFVLVATMQGVWPEAEFLASKPRETDAECIALFHRIIRSIPEPERQAVWREVDRLGLVPRAGGGAH